MFHPLVVEFPRALLTVYADLEFAFLLPVVRKFPWNEYVKAAFLFFGVAGAGMAVISGETAQHIVRAADPSKRQLIQLHSSYADITTFIFCILVAAYALKLLLDLWPAEGRQSPVFKLSQGFQPLTVFILSTPVRLFLALAGLIGISITGALGGALVYGASIDPFVSFVYGLFY